MSRSLRAGRWALATLTLFWAVVPSLAQTVRRSDFPPIALSLTPNRDTYWLGEPVVVRCRLLNWFSPTLIVASALGIQGDSDLRIVQEEKISDRYRAHFDPSPVTPLRYLLKYGKALEYRVVVCYDRQGPSPLALPEPGLYYLRMRQELNFLDPADLARGQVAYGVPAQSPPIQVIPPPAEATGALDILLTDPRALRDTGRLMATLNTRPLLERIAGEYPRSRYAPYCLHALGNLSRRLTPVDPTQGPRARALLAKTVEEYPDYALRDEARLLLASVLKDAGRLDEAVAMVRALVSEDEDNLFRFRKSPLVAPLRGQAGNPYYFLNTACWHLFDTTHLIDAYTQTEVETEGE